MKKYIIWILVIILLCSTLMVGIINHFKKLPDNLSYASDTYSTDDIEFLSDLTYENKDKEMIVEQEIFEEVWQVIDEAEEFVLVDMFLFNDYTDQEIDFPDLSGKLTKKLIDKRKEFPDIPIVFITDPINTGYFSYESKHIEMLKENDIEVVITDLDSLHDSNKPYTSLWRILIKPFGYGKFAWLPNPFASEAPNMTLRSYLTLFNVKANHRKVIASEKHAIIQSANAHNESGYASNIGFKVSGQIINDIVEAEQAVIDYSGGKTRIPLDVKTKSDGEIFIQYLTER